MPSTRSVAAVRVDNNIDVTYNSSTAEHHHGDVEALTTADIAGLDTALTGKQPLDGWQPTAIAGLTLGADNIPYFTGQAVPAGAATATFAHRALLGRCDAHDGGGTDSPDHDRVGRHHLCTVADR